MISKKEMYKQISINEENEESMKSENPGTLEKNCCDEKSNPSTNYFLNKLSTLLDAKDAQTITSLQNDSLCKLKETTELLTNFNDFSADLYKNISFDFEQQFRKYQQLKKELDLIFRRVKKLRVKAKQLQNKNMPKQFQH